MHGHAIALQGEYTETCAHHCGGALRWRRRRRQRKFSTIHATHSTCLRNTLSIRKLRLFETSLRLACRRTPSTSHPFGDRWSAPTHMLPAAHRAALHRLL